MNETLFVGVIQTSLRDDAAWINDSSGKWWNSVRISSIEELRAKREIRHYLASLKGLDKKADIVVLPELSVPIGFERRLVRAAEKLESIVIAGLDYTIVRSKDAVSNDAVVIIPKRLKGKQVSQQTHVRRVGKTYPAPGEQKKLNDVPPTGVKFIPSPVVWIFESVEFGNFAVAVCYDFMDLNRIVMYRGKIQTLFVLAYNRDTTSFDHIAEALARMVFCNVVVCNCGQFGGSLAVSPFREPYKRTIYKHSGQKLPNAQLIELPISTLNTHQQDGKSAAFKSLPPGFSEFIALQTKLQKV